MASAPTFKLRLSDPDGRSLDVDATSVVLPAADGRLGVLADRAAFAAVLAPGRLDVTDSAGLRHYTLAGGIAHMRDNTLLILADKFEEAKS